MPPITIYLYQHDIGWQQMYVDGERTAISTVHYLRALFGVMGHKMYCSAVHPDIVQNRKSRVILAVDEKDKAERIFMDKFGVEPRAVFFERCFGRPVIRRMKVCLYGVNRPG